MYNKDSIKNAFIDTIKSMNLEVDEHLPLREMLKKCLTNSQIYSLSLSHDSRENKVNMEYEQLENLVEITINKLNKDKEIIYAPDYKLTSEFQNIPLIIHGKNNILNTAISIIKVGIEKNHYKKTRILLTFQGENEVFYGSENLHNIFDHEIETALREGIDVCHLLRLNKNINRSFKVIEKIINFLGYKGKYYPYYFNKYGTVKFPMEFIICEGVGALICFSSNNNECFDTAMFYYKEEDVSAIKKHFDLHFIEVSPLVENYSLEEFFKCVTEAENRMGDQFSVENEFATFTYPYSLWIKFLKRTVDDENIMNEHLRRINIRIQSFYEQIEQYKFRSIMNKEQIEKIAKTGKYLSDNNYRKYNVEDIIEHFENIVLILKKYKNYQIALVNNVNNLFSKVKWSVKGENSVFLYVDGVKDFENSGINKNIILLIKETTIVSAFKDYFLDLWDQIPHVDKDNNHVIELLEHQISILKSNVDDNKKQFI